MATVEKLENNKAKLTITVDPATFADAMQKAYVKNVKKYNVPGFRKGKAPRKVVESMYGEGVFYEDAFELVYGKAYDDAVAENGLEPVDRPEISIDEIGSQEGLVFTAEVVLKPEVSLGDYKGIEVVRRAYTVKDEELDAVLQQEREKAARYIEMDRPVENGDRVVLDYSGSVDGVKFDGGTAQDQTLEIGSGAFIPGFEEQLVGMTAGETKDIQVKFPEEYHAEDLKGKDAVFTVTIKTIQVKELPELDDEFIKDISEFDTIEEYKADKRAQLEKRNEERAKGQMEDEAIQKAAQNANMDIPEVMINRQMDYMLQDITYRLASSGLSLEDYCKYMGTDVQTLREGYRAEAENRVRIQLTLEAIAKAEAIEADEETLEKQVKEFAERTGVEADEFKNRLSQDDWDYFKERVIAEKTVQCIMDAANMVDAPEEKEEAQADENAQKSE